MKKSKCENTKKENAYASLEIEVEKENVITEFDKVINSYKKNASLPGFRNRGNSN